MAPAIFSLALLQAFFWAVPERNVASGYFSCICISKLVWALGQSLRFRRLRRLPPITYSPSRRLFGIRSGGSGDPHAPVRPFPSR
ncbi:hypothetical protein GCM10023166_37140 [Paeniglutamicibacter cryotolerans]